MPMWLNLVILCAAVTLLCVTLVFLLHEPLRRRVLGYLDTKTTWASGELDVMFMDVSQRRLWYVFLIGPLGGMGLGFLILHSWLGVGVGFVVGLLIPQLHIMRIKARRRKKFNDQLVDTLMLMSSSLKAGLSILQSFEVLVEEMPPPMSQEFGLLLKENKMGVALNESFDRLRKRIPSDDLNLVVTAIMVARETGGDVTSVFARLVDTIRERKKLLEKVKTLTIQGRMQGYIMMLLPVVFFFFARRMNPEFFDIFFKDDLGRILLIAAACLEVIGAFLIIMFSRVRV